MVFLLQMNIIIMSCYQFFYLVTSSRTVSLDIPWPNLMLRVQYDLSQESEPRAPNPSVLSHVEFSPGYHSHWVLHPRLQLDCFFEASAWFELGHVEQAPATAHHDDDDDDDDDDGGFWPIPQMLIQICEIIHSVVLSCPLSLMLLMFLLSASKPSSESPPNP